eukprot:CAMPEP_0204056896 /NCGR_PEP_ID=MMETSP0360-20130528/133154_1 /ASSEMBLY_ACC=CAM_ASM_000342 /TAXON_ID=268821 /ORGANISM="Scrippsiella Hangoei, Strain SHTV-5" /LENGTH=33 /DNA_ID= /DNA_START= /DNA_END= /DNA_ORIENTATION=
MNTSTAPNTRRHSSALSAALKVVTSAVLTCLRF